MIILQKLLPRLSQPPGIIPWTKVFDKTHPEFRHHWKALWTVPSHRHRLLAVAFYRLQLLAWYMIFVWINFYKGIQYIRKKKQKGENIMTPIVIGRLLHLLFIYTIPLPSIVRYRLLDQRSSVILSHIYPHEVPKWQYALSDSISAHEKRILGDKQYFAQICADKDIPGVATLGVLPQNSPPSALTQWLTPVRSYFVKPPDANRSRGCFIVEWKNGAFQLSELGKETLIEEPALIIEKLANANQEFSLILQPLLKNISLWHDLSVSDELITMRMITELSEARVELLAGVLEIPIEDRGRYYDILPIDPVSGKVHDQFFGLHTPKLNDRQKDLLSKIAGTTVPHWDKILSSLAKAHRLCTNVRTIGWDIAVTERGPVIIEGNSGWSPHSLTLNVLAAKKLEDIMI